MSTPGSTRIDALEAQADHEHMSWHEVSGELFVASDNCPYGCPEETDTLGTCIATWFLDVEACYACSARVEVGYECLKCTNVYCVAHADPHMCIPDQVALEVIADHS